MGHRDCCGHLGEGAMCRLPWIAWIPAPRIFATLADTRPRDNGPVPLPEMPFPTCPILMATFKAEFHSPLLGEALPDFPKQNQGHRQHFEKTPLCDTCHLNRLPVLLSAARKKLKSGTDLFIHVSRHSA